MIIKKRKEKKENRDQSEEKESLFRINGKRREERPAASAGGKGECAAPGEGVWFPIRSEAKRRISRKKRGGKARGQCRRSFNIIMGAKKGVGVGKRESFARSCAGKGGKKKGSLKSMSVKRCLHFIFTMTRRKRRKGKRPPQAA